MKVLNSSPVSAFGGLNFVIKEAIDLKINSLLNKHLPALPKQSQYNWFDILMSYAQIFNVPMEFSLELMAAKTGNVDHPIPVF